MTKGDQFRRVFEENPIGMIMTGPDLKCLKANHTFCRMSGYAQKDLKRMLITDLIHPDDLANSADSLERLIRGELPSVRLEKRFLRKNGAWMWGDANVFYPACDGDLPLYLIATVEDVTEKKRAAQDTALLAAALSSSADAVIITDTDGRIRYVNGAFEKITGFTEKEVLGANLKDLAAKTAIGAGFPAAFDETVRSASPWSGTTSNLRKDGAAYTAEETISPVRDRDGNVINAIVIKRDITEKLRLESIADAVNTMDNIGYIFSGIRHEIGNPLSSVKMALSVMRNKLESGYTRELIDKYLDRAMAELSRMEYLLAALKSFNIYETPDMKDIDVTAFVRDLRNLLLEDFRKKGIKIRTHIQPAASRALADPRALQQVVLNIITNAADALKDRPGPAIDIKVMKMGDRVLIHVEDNGCGMSAEQLKNAFRPFYTTKPSGTGLGLMLARKMITRMNGTIEITSERDAGTAVDIFIPESASGQ